MIVRRKSDKTYKVFKVNDDQLPALLRMIADTVRIDTLGGTISVAWGRGGPGEYALIAKDLGGGDPVHYKYFADEGQYVLFHSGEVLVVDPPTYAAVYEEMEEVPEPQTFGGFNPDVRGWSGHVYDPKRSVFGG